MIKALASALSRPVIAGISEATSLPFSATFPDLTTLVGGRGEPQVHFHIKTASAAWRTALYGHIGFLESYFDGGIEVEGDLRRLVALGFDAGFDRTSGWLVAIRNRWHGLRFNNRTGAKPKENARFHYGLGASFYAKMLDEPYLMYTCAYYEHPAQCLLDAQIAKMAHVARKVRLTARGSRTGHGLRLRRLHVLRCRAPRRPRHRRQHHHGTGRLDKSQDRCARLRRQAGHA